VSVRIRAIIEAKNSLRVLYICLLVLQQINCIVKIQYLIYEIVQLETILEITLFND